MQIFPRGVTEFPPQAILADEVYGFEVRVDISRHTRARTKLRVEVFASPDGQRWEVAGRGEAESDTAPKDQFGAPRQFWTFGTGFKSPRVERGLLVGWNARWSAPQYKVLITATGGDVEAEVLVEPITQTEQPTQHLPFHRSVHIVQIVQGHDEGGSGATTANITTVSGNALKLFASYYGDYVSFTDSKSNTWTDISGEMTAIISPYRGRTMYAKNITGGASHNFTFSHSTGGYGNFLIVESFDEHLTASLDQQAQDASGVTSITTGTLSQAKQIVFGFNSASGGGSYSVPAGWFQLHMSPNATLLGLNVAYKIVNSTAAITWNPDPSGSGTGTPPLAVATFKETATPAFVAVKPSGSPSYTTTKAWTANTKGHWLMNESGSPTSQGAVDISGNGFDLVAVKEGALDYPATGATSPIGVGRTFVGGGDDVDGLVTPDIESDLSFTGAMSAMCVWRDNGQAGAGNTHDPVVFAVGAHGADSCFTLCFNLQTNLNKFVWYDGAAGVGFVSNTSFGVLTDPFATYRLMITRSGAGSGSTVRFFYQPLDGRPMVKDVDTTGTDDSDGTPSYFTIGCSKWNADEVLSQGIKQHIFEMRLWDVELSEATVAAYFADPYGEFATAPSGVSASAFDPIAVSEAVELNMLLMPQLFDSVSVAESVTVQLVAIANLLPNVFDSVVVSENLTVQLSIGPAVSDTITVQEAATALLNRLTPSVSDTITVQEVASARLNRLMPNVFDTITVAESITILLVSAGIRTISVSDSIAVGEQVSVNLFLPPVTVFDTLTVTEQAAVHILMLLQVNDSISVTEDVTVRLPVLALAVSDSVAVEESISVFLGAEGTLPISGVFDSVTVAESVAVLLNPLAIGVFDTVSVSERVTARTREGIILPPGDAQTWVLQARNLIWVLDR